jgi:hypothetical protein
MSNDGLCIQENYYSMVEDVYDVVEYEIHPYKTKEDGKNDEKENW